MANRSHLYAFDRFENGLPYKPRGLHEWNHTIPVSHQLLISGKPRAYNSSILTGKQKAAVVGDYEPGVARFWAFMRALEASKVLPDELSTELKAAEEFLARDSSKGRFLLLEPFEIFQFSETALDTQCATFVSKQLATFTAQVDALVARPPEKLFQKPPAWLAAIKKDWGSIGLGYWSSVLYYSLDG